MERRIQLQPLDLKKIRTVNSRLVSYNIEMTEITGGTFWRAYTPGQIAGLERFQASGLTSNFTNMSDLMQYYPPINLYDERLRSLARALGPAWIRISGTWSTKTYYDFEGTTSGIAPKGYASVLTKEQWIGVLDFVRAVGGKLLISVSNCAGDHLDGGPLALLQAQKIFDFSHKYGVDIDAAEFMNEPNMLEVSGAPRGYTAADYARDQDLFFHWIREHYPNCLCAGPCALGDGAMGKLDLKSVGAGIGAIVQTCSTDDLMRDTQESLDIFSYHYYNGVSERLMSNAPEGHWDSSEAHTDGYLAIAAANAQVYAPLRDKYVPGEQMWVTESGDAGGGGNTWASTYLDVLRTLNELGSFALISNGVIFHNTLASSDYGFLQHETFEPRPNYFAVLLWNQLMGTTVYGIEKPVPENAHVYCHSRKDGKSGYTYLVINNSLVEQLDVELPCKAERYTLNAESPRSQVMMLNGQKIGIDASASDPGFLSKSQEAGVCVLPPCSCTFLVL